MEIIQETSENSVSFGVPRCECGQCWRELEVELGIIDVGMDAIKQWLEGVCPGPEADRKTG